VAEPFIFDDWQGLQILCYHLDKTGSCSLLLGVTWAIHLLSKGILDGLLLQLPILTGL
jgi:hypothetical protein